MIALLVWKFQFEETPPELSSWEAFDQASHRAKQTYVQLKEIEI